MRARQRLTDQQIAFRFQQQIARRATLAEFQTAFALANTRSHKTSSSCFKCFNARSLSQSGAGTGDSTRRNFAVVAVAVAIDRSRTLAPGLLVRLSDCAPRFLRLSRATASALSASVY